MDYKKAGVDIEAGYNTRMTGPVQPMPLSA